MVFDGKRVLVTGGTGSLGHSLLRRIVGGSDGVPARVEVFSRDEAKQDEMRREFGEKVRFRIGDVRDFGRVCSAVRDADIVINAAALKQVPSCEYAPFEAVLTNVIGAENIVRAIDELNLPVETVVAISTDKACKPVNTMGMTKAIQERIFIHANLRKPSTRFVCVRYGNVVASRGSVVPLFLKQIAEGGPVTITAPDMTRFLLPLDAAVEVTLAALRNARRGEVFVPRAPSARVIDLARALIAGRPLEVLVLGRRPGEKMHEIMVSEEEVGRTRAHERNLVIAPMLRELQPVPTDGALKHEYGSEHGVLTREQLTSLLARVGLLPNNRELHTSSTHVGGL